METIEKIILEKRIYELEMKLLEVQIKADKALDILETVSHFMDTQVKINNVTSDLLGRPNYHLS
jgi:hypothetical protein